ncbi:MAG: nicotinate phosphoribosyltransferase, partial [Longimicrobiales bacterium]
LLEIVMRGGARLPAGKVSLEQARAHAASQIAALPDHVSALTAAAPPYEVTVSDHLEALRRRLALDASAEEPPP